MLKTLFCAILCITPANLQILLNIDNSKEQTLFFLFNTFIDFNQKKYSNTEEYLYRFEIFKRNIKDIIGDLKNI